MSPDLLSRWAGPVRAALCGAALGVVAFASGSLILYASAGMLPAVAGLAATFVAALAAGAWAGAPGARAGAPPTRRWVLAGLALGAAGVFAALWSVMGGASRGAPLRMVALLLLVGVPVYALGMVFSSLAVLEADGADAAAEDEDADEPHAVDVVGRVVIGALAGLVIGVALTGLLLLPRVPPGTLLLGTAALLTFPLAFPRVHRDEDAGERLLYEAETPFGSVRVTEIVFAAQRQPELRLYQNDEIESGELARSGAPSFGYIAAAERWLAATTEPGAAYLFLGGGAYTLPRRVAERDARAEITVVELDPEVTRVARRFFGLRPEHAIRSLHGDARAVAAALRPTSFDRIFLDVYGGTEAIPAHLVTAEALTMLGALLRPGGLLLVNVIGVARGEGELRLWSTVRTAAETFPSCALYFHLGRDYPERQNFLLAVSPEPGVEMPAAAGSFERWPDAEWRMPEGTTVYRDRADGA